MGITRTARVPTTSGSRYHHQLCKHWAHKFKAEFDASAGWVDLPMGRATMVVEPDELVVTLTVEGADKVEIMQDVVAKHLDRFAFREAPLPFDWQ